MKFRNIKTGNVLETENKDAIALMTASEQYEAVKEKKPGKGKNQEPGGDGTPAGAE